MADPRNTQLGTATVNEQLQDRMIRHLVYLTRLSNEEARKIIAAIESELIPDIMAQITGSIERLRSERILAGQGGTISPLQVQRLNALASNLSSLVETFNSKVRTALAERLLELAQREIQFESGILKNALPIDFDFTNPSPQQLRTIINAQPFDGRDMDQWFKSLGRQTRENIMRQIRAGMVEGESIDQIARRIRGRQAQNFTDGVLQTTRRNAAAIARSAVIHTSNQARQEFHRQNSDLIKAEQWVATLDVRTCTECMGLDGRSFDIGDGRRPPAHVGCRCIMVPVTKSWRELGIDLDEAPEGTRASMNGQVPEKMTFGEWLRRQPAAIQDEALGPTRGKLFRKGELKISAFTNRQGDTINLDVLMRKERDAFEAAGVEVP